MTLNFCETPLTEYINVLHLGGSPARLQVSAHKVQLFDYRENGAHQINSISCEKMVVVTQSQVLNFVSLLPLVLYYRYGGFP